MTVLKSERDLVAKLTPLGRLEYIGEHVPESLVAGILATNGGDYCVVGWLAALDAVPKSAYMNRSLLHGSWPSVLAAYYNISSSDLFELMSANDVAPSEKRHAVVVGHLKALYQAHHSDEEQTQ